MSERQNFPQHQQIPNLNHHVIHNALPKIHLRNPQFLHKRNNLYLPTSSPLNVNILAQNSPAPPLPHIRNPSDPDPGPGPPFQQAPGPTAIFKPNYPPEKKSSPDSSRAKPSPTSPSPHLFHHPKIPKSGYSNMRE
jgi:hypothetical protein